MFEEVFIPILDRIKETWNICLDRFDELINRRQPPQLSSEELYRFENELRILDNSFSQQLYELYNNMRHSITDLEEDFGLEPGSLSNF